MLRAQFYAVLFLALTAAAGCRSDVIEGTGTVRYSNLEGGFFAIATSDGETLDPMNLAERWRVDGLRVHFKARPVRAASVHMVGPVVEILSIRPLEERAGGVFAYTGYNADRRPVVQGTLNISWPPHALPSGSSAEIQGTWRLQALPPLEDIGPQVGTGRLRGSLTAEGQVDIDLNPDMADNNVYLHGAFESGIGSSFRGEWNHSTLVGPIKQGTFEARRK